MWDLTNEGRRVLRAKHAEIFALHGRITEQYNTNRAGFYEAIESYAWALPMMVVMGFGGGAMMAHAHSVADASCMMHGDYPDGADVGCDVGGDAGLDTALGVGF